MAKFIGYTVGLECNKGEQVGKLVKVEYSRNSDHTVSLSAVSGRNHAKLPGAAVISAEQYEDRPSDPYDNIAEARWALAKVGYTLMADDCE